MIHAGCENDRNPLSLANDIIFQIHRHHRGFIKAHVDSGGFHVAGTGHNHLVSSRVQDTRIMNRVGGRGFALMHFTALNSIPVVHPLVGGIGIRHGGGYEKYGIMALTQNDVRAVFNDFNIRLDKDIYFLISV